MGEHDLGACNILNLSGLSSCFNCNTISLCCVFSIKKYYLHNAGLISGTHTYLHFPVNVLFLCNVSLNSSLKPFIKAWPG